MKTLTNGTLFCKTQSLQQTQTLTWLTICGSSSLKVRRVRSQERVKGRCMCHGSPSTRARTELFTCHSVRSDTNRRDWKHDGTLGSVCARGLFDVLFICFHRSLIIYYIVNAMRFQVCKDRGLSLGTLAWKKALNRNICYSAFCKMFKIAIISETLVIPTRDWPIIGLPIFFPIFKQPNNIGLKLQ